VLKLKELVKSKKLLNFGMMTAKGKLLAIVALVAVLAVIGVIYQNNKKPVQAAGEIYTTKAVLGNIVNTLESEGILEPIERKELSAKVSGVVGEILVGVGDQVEAGQLLMRVSNESAFSTARQTQLEWEIDAAELEDLKSPYAEDNYTRREAELKVEEYRIALEDKKEERDKLEAEAPFTGTLLSIDVKLGQRVTTGTQLATVATSDDVEVVTSFSDQDIGSISVDMEAQVMVKGLNKTYFGKVKEVAFAGDSSTSKFEVLIGLDDPDDALREGMTTYNTVTIVRDEDQDILLFKQASGYIRYVKKEDITANASGTVEEIYYKSGDKLAVGTPVLRIANDDLDRQVKAAEIQLAKAEESLRLLLDPYSTTIRKQELVVEESYERMVESQENAESLNVTAPFGGTVVSIPVKANEEISANQTLIIVSNFEKNRLEITIDELDISQLSVGQKVAVKVDALTGVTLSGEVAEINQEGNSSNGITSYPVVLEVGNAEGVKAGMSGTVTIVLASKENTLLVPAEAVTTTSGRSFVTVLENGEQKARQVKVGINNGSQAEIIEGLSEGEQVVVASKTTAANTQTNMMIPGAGGMGGAPPAGGMPQGGTTPNRTGNTGGTRTRN